ncbi:hypothetical protein SAMN05428977_102134 [Nitrosomonas sp. Nm166]|nr:hypothetical protein SAMN05428977_102134 [Nitrosomonas sp. Nm166]
MEALYKPFTGFDDRGWFPISPAISSGKFSTARKQWRLLWLIGQAHHGTNYSYGYLIDSNFFRENHSMNFLVVLKMLLDSTCFT